MQTKYVLDLQAACLSRLCTLLRADPRNPDFVVRVCQLLQVRFEARGPSRNPKSIF